MRAFAVRVDVASGVSGFLRPGDRVDVYWSGRAGSDAAEMTKLIETGVRLVAVDQSADEDHSNPVVARTVTVEVTPRQVATLAQAQNTGRLSLALVGAADNSTAASVEIDQRELLGIEERQIAAEPPGRGLHDPQPARRRSGRDPDPLHELSRREASGAEMSRSGRRSGRPAPFERGTFLLRRCPARMIRASGPARGPER